MSNVKNPSAVRNPLVHSEGSDSAKIQNNEFRDVIERLEAEQAAFCVSLEGEPTNVIPFPTSPPRLHFSPQWENPDHEIEVLQQAWPRALELNRKRSKLDEPAAMTMMAPPDDPSFYYETAIKGELDKLRNCPPGSQDSTMNAVAFALAGMEKGWPVGSLKARFLDECATLRNDPKAGKGPWTRRDFEAKWNHGYKDATPRPPKDGQYGPHQTAKAAPDKGKRDYALKILDEAVPFAGTIGEKYFRETRGVDPGPAMDEMFFHPSVSCSDLGKGRKMAAIVTPYKKHPGGEAIAAHVTYLNPDGTKPDLEKRKRTFGKGITGSALYLMPIGSMTIVAEGIEKALACGKKANLPAIAAGFAVMLGGMAIAPGIETLIICADRGEDGEKNAEALAKRAHAAGIEVKLLYPPIEGADWDECPDREVFETIWDGSFWEPFDVQQSGAPSDFAGKVGAAEWPEPQPIDAPLYPVPAFDPQALLPDGLRDFVMDAAYRMPCAPEYVAAATIAFGGSTIGARCAIRPKRCDDWLITSNVWGAIVGDPGQKKSPAVAEAEKPIKRLIGIAIKEHKEALAGAECDGVVRDARKAAITKKIKEAAKGDDASIEQLKEELKAHLTASQEAPLLRRYLTNDSTVEKLGELLRENPAGILVVRDEVVGLIASWDKTGREGDRQFFLEAWNGTGSFDTDRIGRGSIRIPNHCVTLFGGMQPDKLTEYLEQASDALGNDGLLQRIQLRVYPDPVPWEWRDRVPNGAARERVNSIFEKLAAFDPAQWGASPSRPGIKFPYFFFDDAAQDFYIGWMRAFHKRIMAESNPLIRQHLEKYDKLFPALALIFHMIGMADGSTRTEISEACARRAAAWCDFLESHARRCYELLADGGLRSAQALAKKLKGADLPQSLNPEDFTARDLRRLRWRYLADEEAVDAALDWLENKGWLRSRKVGGSGPGSGHPTYRYTINPKVRGKE